MVKYFIVKGADMFHRLKDGSSPIMMACWKGCLEMVKILVD